MAIVIDIDPVLAPFIDRVDTRRNVLETDLLPRTASILAEVLPEGRWLVVSDVNTHAVAGQAVEDSLTAADQPFDRYTVAPAEGEETPVANDEKVEQLRAHLEANPAIVAVVAVGAGTINDIAKLATTHAGRPYAVVGTAPSMNGYTSAIAAILSQGVKVTLPCTAPVACLADLGVMAAAPYRMIASGYGDLLSKPVSNADWRLSHRLLGSFHSSDTMTLVEGGFALLEGIAPRLVERDLDAVGRLTAALCISGMAMAVAGSSAPASGGEHLISHYIDMTHFAYGDPHDFHGCQVGVGTITTAALYERFMALDPDTIDVDALVAAIPDPAAYEALVRERFGVLQEAVVGHMKALFPAPDDLRARLTRLKDEWPSIVKDVGATLQTADTIRGNLLDAGCPVTFEAIGVNAERARRSVLHCKDIRGRYTILHMAWELGLLETWTDDILRTYHGIDA